MRTSCWRSRVTLAAVRSRTWPIAAALIALLVLLPPNAGAASKKHRLRAFASCSSFVHYARRHAVGELTRRGVPVGPPLPVVGARQPMGNKDPGGGGSLSRPHAPDA